MQYIQDYDEKYPPTYVSLDGDATYTAPAANAVPAANADQGWAQIIQPYMKSTQLLQCPSESGSPQTNGAVGYSDYFYNALLGGGSTLGTDVPGAAGTTGGISQASAQNVASTIMAGDNISGHAANYSLGNYDSGNGYEPVGAFSVERKATFPNNVATRHLDTQVFLFADGHVKSLRGTNNNPSNTQSISNAVWNGYTDFDTSGGDPTFNVSKQTNP
jgi:hypothetical protein